jgi:hypothetical protein
MENKTPKVFIKTTNKKDKKAATILLMKLSDMEIHQTFEDLDDFCKLWSCYPVISNVGSIIDGHSFRCDKYEHIAQFDYPSQISEIIEHLVGIKTYKMKLTDEYEAVVSNSGIEVGCQTISFKKLNELNELVAEYRKDKN